MSTIDLPSSTAGLPPDALLQGKATYIALIVLAVGWLAKAQGYILSADQVNDTTTFLEAHWADIVQLIGLIGAALGRYRASLHHEAVVKALTTLCIMVVCALQCSCTVHPFSVVTASGKHIDALGGSFGVKARHEAASLTTATGATMMYEREDGDETGILSTALRTAAQVKGAQAAAAALKPFSH